MTVLTVPHPLVTEHDITFGPRFRHGMAIAGDAAVSGLEIPLPAVVSIGSRAGIIPPTWVLGPSVTRVVSWWLASLAPRDAAIRGVLILIGLCAATVAATVAIDRGRGFWSPPEHIRQPSEGELRMIPTAAPDVMRDAVRDVPPASPTDAGFVTGRA
ncbi:MAG: hypothetical protein ACYC2Z_02675 [Candidatus Nanopelagicales bacterium]